MEKEAFTGCDRLEEVSFPESITVVEEGAFSYCEKIKTVKYAGTKAEWEKVSVSEGDNEYLLLCEDITCSDGKYTL